MALTDENSNGMVMPVAPMYGNGNGFGGDSWAWIILLLLLAGNGWGNGFGFGGYGGGIGAMAADGAMLYPWINQSQQVNDGFRDQMISGNINSIRDGIGNLATQICGATGDIQNTLCSGFAGTNATINNGFANAETAANARQIANMQQAFNAQSAVTAGMNALQAQLAQCLTKISDKVKDFFSFTRFETVGTLAA